MSATFPFRSLDSILRAEWIAASVDYWGYLYPGDLVDKPNPPLHPFSRGYKLVKTALWVASIRSPYSGIGYAS